MSKKPIPKDKQIIIETPYGTYASMWNVVNKEFIYANPQINMFEGECINSYFETKSIKEEKIISWREF